MTKINTNSCFPHNTDLMDVFFKDFFNDESKYTPLNKIHYPVDIYEIEDEGLYFEIIAIGIEKKNVEITTLEGDVLKVKCNNGSEIPGGALIHTRNITRRDIDFGWKIPGRFDIEMINASYEDGVIKIHLPIKESSKPKTIKVK